MGNIIYCSEDKLLQDEVINILPLVQNVNAMAEEMQKLVAFSMMLVSPEARGLDHGRTEVSHCKPLPLLSSNSQGRPTPLVAPHVTPGTKYRGCDVTANF